MACTTSAARSSFRPGRRHSSFTSPATTASLYNAGAARLMWIGMVHDYWRYQDEPGFVREMLPGVRAALI
jgi:hypothetical protein